MTALETPDEHLDRNVLRSLRDAAAAAPALTAGFGVTVLLAIVGTAGQLVVPIAIQQVLDNEVLGSDRIDLVRVAAYCGGALALLVVALLANRSALMRMIRAGADGLHQLRTAAFRHIHDLSVLHVQSERRGVLVARVTSDIETITGFLEWGGVAMVVGTAQVLLTTLVMLVYDWRLALLVVAAATTYAGLLVFFQRVLRRLYDDVRRRNGEALGAVSEAVVGLPTIRAYGTERRTLERVDTSFDRLKRSEFRAGATGAAMFSSAELFAASTTAAVVAAGIWLGQGAGLTAGALVAFLFLVVLFIEPVQTLVETSGEAQTAAAGIRRVLEVLDSPREVADPVDGVDLPPGELDLTVEHLWYRYPDTEEDVLVDVSVAIAAGRRVAVVGETGSGKSTFAKLVTRLIDPTRGRIDIGGVPVDRVRFRSLRDRVVFVPQEGFLFDGTIADNVRYGDPTATDDDVRRAFADLELAGWLEAQPAGVTTQVGERGGRLSSGERQLVALVRAWIARPDLLVLDEATSAVDPVLEVRLRRAIERLTEGRTSVTIAHRLSTARAADDVLVFDGGRLVEHGTHADLVGRGGVYAGLWADWTSQTASAS
jgi:ATP-binding cassette, subfamily B, bacterial